MSVDLSNLFPEQSENRAKGLCATCGEIPDTFKDELSEREFQITGQCQTCQDEIFS